MFKVSTSRFIFLTAPENDRGYSRVSCNQEGGPAPLVPCLLVRPSCLQLMPGQGARREPDVETDPAEMGVPICSWIRAL